MKRFKHRSMQHRVTGLTGESVVASLRSALGDAVSIDPLVLAGVREDKSGHRSASAPLAVVTARSIEDVQATLRIASEFGVPVVPRGAGTGLAGGAIAGQGEIVLSTLAMDRILEVSAADELAVIEPGILNGDFNAALEPHGLWFAPDPASKAISTVGGNIATNAGGLLCAKYGVTREAVLGLKVVLADGRLLSLGHRSVKGVTGLDLTALMIGSEGTLGVIVEATVRLRPLVTGTVATIGAYFADVDCRGIRVGRDHRGRPATRRHGAARCRVAARDRQPPRPRPRRARRRLAAGADGWRGQRRRGGRGPRDHPFARRRRGAHHRPRGGGAAARHPPGVPPVARGARHRAHRGRRGSAQRAAADVRRDRRDRRSASASGSRPSRTRATATCTPTSSISPTAGSTEVPAQVWAAADELFLAALRLGGTLTGEHGVGILKRRWLRDELGDDQFELQRQLKARVRPAGHPESWEGVLSLLSGEYL